MQKGVNKVTILGNVGQDPDVRFTKEQKPIANVSVATSETWKDKNGQDQQKTEWHKIVVFGKLAEIVSKYVKRGSQVYFEGKLETRKWQDDAGNDRYSTEIIVDGFGGVVQLLGGRSESANPVKVQEKKPVENVAIEDLDDIPFK